jgi:beta-lactam-binding protein with PASTA domain
MTDQPQSGHMAAPDPMPADARPRVPDIIGLSLEDAGEAAAWAGIKLSATTTARAHGPLGVVIAQSPSPGTRLEPHWRLHVLVTTSWPTEGPPDG